jgi:CubicO group peptidase (beta-lactamase class C family)
MRGIASQAGEQRFAVTWAVALNYTVRRSCVVQEKAMPRINAVRLSLRLVIVLVLSVAAAAEDTVARLNGIVESYVSSKQFMGSVMVEQDGKVLLNKGYGFANMEWEIPNTPATKFRLGSVTKQFTAASILLLEQAGKLKTDDPVKKYIVDAPAAWDKVTIFHLLTHTSGIPSFTGFSDYVTTQGTATTPESLVKRFRDKPLEFQPGEKWSYSNSGYVLLGYIIEKVSGKSYAEFVAENIFKPLGMNDSGYDSNSAVIAHRAAGYVPTPTGPSNAGFIHMSVPFSAGALYSTTEDMMRWENGLFGGKLLSPASLEKMTTAFKQDYGLGVFVAKENGHRVIGHAGGIDGFNTQVSYYPDDKLKVIVLGNLNGAAPTEIAQKLAAAARGDKIVLPTERKEVSVAPAVMAKYVGNYQLAPTFVITINQEGDHLLAQATGQPKLPIFAESETMFFYKIVDAQLEFFKNDKGETTHLVLHQGGRNIEGKRQ